MKILLTYLTSSSNIENISHILEFRHQNLIDIFNVLKPVMSFNLAQSKFRKTFISDDSVPDALHFTLLLSLKKTPYLILKIKYEIHCIINIFW